MGHHGFFRLVICCMLVPVLMFPAACASRHVPARSNRNLHTVVAIVAPLTVQSLPHQKAYYLETSSGKAKASSIGAGLAFLGLWAECGHVMGSASGNDSCVTAFAVVVFSVCVLLTPFAVLGGAAIGAATASPSTEEVAVRQEYNQSLAERKQAVAVFEEHLYGPGAKRAGREVRSGKEHGLSNQRPDQDYRDLSAQGVDAVLEVNDLAVVLTGTDIEKPLALRACASFNVIDTSDSSVLYHADRCESAIAYKRLEEWSADQWAAVRSEAPAALERLALSITGSVFSETAQADIAK